MKMDILIENADIITGSTDRMYIGKGFIGITDGRISHMGDKPPAFTEKTKRLDATGMTAMPGLQNAHTHSPMVLLRNYAADKPLEKWLGESILPVEDRMTREHIRAGTVLALAEMIKSGTTAFLDMYFESDVTADEVIKSGMKANISLGLLTSHRLGEGVDKAKDFCRDFFKKYDGTAGGRLKTSLEVHSVYLYDEKTLRESAGFAAQTGMIVNIHLHETKSEVDDAIAGYGCSPIQICNKYGLLEGRTVAAHAVWMDSTDLEIMKEKNVVPVHNPSSNMYLGSGFAPIPAMLEMGIKPALGTDGAASNNNLDMLVEMRMAALIHKGRKLDASAVNASQVIEMATSTGAKAMGFCDSGVLCEGAAADLILIRSDTPSNAPVINPLNAVVYSTGGADVDTVIVDGRILMQGRRLTTIDEEKAMFDAQKAASELLGI